MDTTDRLSELPEFILHDILSILDPKEACRASVLSKNWYGVWASIPVLDFQLQYFKEDWDIYRKSYGVLFDDDYFPSDDYTLFVAFIDKTMQRYFTQKYRIKKLTIRLPMFDEMQQPLVDKWVRIAVGNKIEELVIEASNYRLPGVLFTTKSLKVLNCLSVQLPYYENIELISLEYLTLDLERGTAADENMLQRIISFCPLVELVVLDICENISIPWTRKLNKGAECFGSGTMQASLKTSPLRRLYYYGASVDMNVVALKNLRKLEIECAHITDRIVSELVYGLESLESLRLCGCLMLRRIKISSISLKEFRIESSLNLITATIDAPNLLEFWYNCKVESSLLFIRTQDSCNAYCFPRIPMVESITTAWFVKLKKFLTETNFFKYLVMDLSYCEQVSMEIDEDQLRNVATSPPYKLKELKLRATCYWRSLTESCIMAFLDGLFWSCHPDVLSITSNYFENSGTQPIVETLKRKVKCWKHPLKNIEVEGIDSSRLLSESSEHEIRLRLSWSSF